MLLTKRKTTTTNIMGKRRDICNIKLSTNLLLKAFE